MNRRSFLTAAASLIAVAAAPNAVLAQARRRAIIGQEFVLTDPLYLDFSGIDGWEISRCHFLWKGAKSPTLMLEITEDPPLNLDATVTVRTGTSGIMRELIFTDANVVVSPYSRAFVYRATASREGNEPA